MHFLKVHKAPFFSSSFLLFSESRCELFAVSWSQYFFQFFPWSCVGVDTSEHFSRIFPKKTKTIKYNFSSEMLLKLIRLFPRQMSEQTWLASLIFPSLVCSNISNDDSRFKWCPCRWEKGHIWSSEAFTLHASPWFGLGCDCTSGSLSGSWIRHAADVL